MKPNDLLVQRASLVEDMRNMIKVTEAENRDFNDTELGAQNKMESDVDALKNRADRLHASNELENSLDKLQDVSVKPSVDGASNSFAASKEYRNAFDTAMRKGKATLSADVLNALQVGTDSEGGYITPEEFDTMLVAARQDINELRQYATVITTGSDRNIPTEATLGTASWTAEEAAASLVDTAFGRIVLGSHKMTTAVKVSDELLQDSFFNVEAYLAGVIGKRFGLLEEAAFVNGDGSGKPTGIVQGSTLGKTLASATAITEVELMDIFHSLGRPYRAGATWMFNDTVAKNIRKLVDGNGQFIWQPGLVAGQPDTILSRPVLVSSAMPAPTTGLKSIIFGDLKGYTIADRKGTSVQRLNELYAINGQVGYVANARTEGKVTDTNAIIHAIQA